MTATPETPAQMAAARRRLLNLTEANKGSLLVIVAALLFACKGTLIKYIYSLGAGVADVMVLRLSFSLPIYLWVAWRHLAGARHRLTEKQWIGVALCGVIGYYVSSYLDMLGLEYVSVGLERVILYTYPAFVVIFSTLLLRQSLSSTLCIYIAAIYLGLLLVFYADIHGRPAASLADIAKGSLFVLASAMTFATYVIGSEYLMRSLPSALFTALMMIAAGIAMSIHYALFDSFAALRNLSPDIYLWCAVTAVVFTVLPAFMMSAGVRRVGAATAGALGMIGPIATIGIAAAFLGESLSAAQVIGLIVVMAGVYRVHGHKS
jgi:drug/metabolite transporter (DMT)-like permease